MCSHFRDDGGTKIRAHLPQRKSCGTVTFWLTGEGRLKCRLYFHERFPPSSHKPRYCDMPRSLSGYGFSVRVSLNPYRAPHSLRKKVCSDSLDERQFIVCNKNREKTCVRSTSGFTIDLTVSSGAVAARVSGWEVLSDFKSLSDHAYVAFSFRAPRSSGRGQSSCPTGLASSRPGGV